MPGDALFDGFADQRVFMGVPHAADVLSNLAFVAVAVLGLWRLGGTVIPLARVVRVGLLVFFAGNFLAGIGSAYYHWDPNDQTLVGDRVGMTIAFAGMRGVWCALLSWYLIAKIAETADVAIWLATGETFRPPCHAVPEHTLVDVALGLVRSCRSAPTGLGTA